VYKNFEANDRGNQIPEISAVETIVRRISFQAVRTFPNIRVNNVAKSNNIRMRHEYRFIPVLFEKATASGETG
jgi:hypothetical protein